MSENTTTTTSTTVQLSETQLAELMALPAIVAAQQTELTQLRERDVQTNKKLREAVVENQIRQLTQAKTVTVTDGDGKTAHLPAAGFTAEAMTQLREVLVENPDAEAGVLKLMQAMQAGAAFQLRELGVSHDGQLNDPVNPTAPGVPGRPTDIIQLAEAAATKNGKQLSEMSLDEKLAQFEQIELQQARQNRAAAR